MPVQAIREFFRLESAAGILLMAAAALAIILDNSQLAGLYDQLLTVQVTVAVGSAGISKPLLLWVNDGLMAVFFTLVGMELKREVFEGELSSRDQIALPGLAAVGGMVVPAAVYWFFNAGDPVAMRGWAIPAATDIAFALGILSLLGNRVPLAAKLFLTALAIADDIGAIVIIAIFYTADLSAQSLILAAVAIALLVVLNLSSVSRLAPYILTGVILWVFVLKSGVHATLAGVIVGMSVPMRDKAGGSPLKHLEHILHPWVAYAILPLFAFANAGLHLLDLRSEDLVAPVSLGIAFGLFIGKQLGAFGFAVVAVKTGLARLPDNVGWAQLYGVCVLTGVGFTMSLFIGSLAFEGPEAANATRLGVLAGSLLSAVLGYFWLRATAKRTFSE